MGRTHLCESQFERTVIIVTDGTSTTETCSETQSGRVSDASVDASETGRDKVEVSA